MSSETATKILEFAKTKRVLCGAISNNDTILH